MQCRHCYRPRPLEHRGLCVPCYRTPEVRVHYAALDADPSPVPCSSPGPVPAAPTLARPGSLEKIAEMHERAKRGERLDHPRDARGDEPGAFGTIARLNLGASTGPDQGRAPVYAPRKPAAPAADPLPDDALVTQAEAAAQLGVAASAIWGLTKRPPVRVHPAGKRWVARKGYVAVYRLGDFRAARAALLAGMPAKHAEQKKLLWALRA